VAGWALLRIIDMDRLTLSGVPTGDMFFWSSAAAFARDSGELFVQAESGIFMINIRSMQLGRVLEASGSAIYPYATSYTPGTCLQKLTPVAAQIDGAVHFSHKTSFDSLISPDREDQAKMIFSNATTATNVAAKFILALLSHHTCSILLSFLRSPILMLLDPRRATL
jgi:hypothetical protein